MGITSLNGNSKLVSALNPETVKFGKDHSLNLDQVKTNFPFFKPASTAFTGNRNIVLGLDWIAALSSSGQPAAQADAETPKNSEDGSPVKFGTGAAVAVRAGSVGSVNAMGLGGGSIIAGNEGLGTGVGKGCDSGAEGISGAGALFSLLALLEPVESL